MNGLATGPADDFCRQHGISRPFHAERIRAGRNSEVSRIHNRDGQWILKRYYRHPGDARDRLGTEFGFLRFLQSAGVPGVPIPLAMDNALQLGLYSFLPGSRPQSITSTHVSQAADFIADMNRAREIGESHGLRAAADACASWQDHIDLARSRIDRLTRTLPETQVAAQALQFAAEHLLPCWTRLTESLSDASTADDRSADLLQQHRILSPSDFGFHNALEHGGTMYFVDFEYAGWDDPAKLICDFICQPELPVSSGQGRQFMEEVAGQFPRGELITHRVLSLLPFHRLKWCCILLNDFRQVDRDRRLHASGVDAVVPLADQLAKAQHYFAAHLAAN